MVSFIRSDLEFILQQIKIAQAGGIDGSNLVNVIPNVQLPWGLRTVDGSYNNLVYVSNPTVFLDQHLFGAADTVFPRALTPTFRVADPVAFDVDGPGGQAVGDPTSYVQTSGSVFDAQPRIISNLIVDQTANNPAAVAAAGQNPNSGIVMSPGLDGIFGTADDRPVEFIPNVAPNAGLAAPFNAWFTFFGQFFDHGLDLVTKGGQDLIFVPLMPDDPLVAGTDGVFGTADDLAPQLRFMVETRGTNVAVHPGPDGVLGTADDVHDNQNTTTPFIDQNQTYTSNPSHQVFLRGYQLLTVDPDGAGPLAAITSPYNTGKLITNKDLGADGHFGGINANADTEIGGMATWGVVKAQARDLLGIHLTDADVSNVPMLATDAYGNFIPGAHGMPQVVVDVAETIAGVTTHSKHLIEGVLNGIGLDLQHPPIPLDVVQQPGATYSVSVVRTGHQFLIDIAHDASPVDDFGNPLVADADNIVNPGAPAPGTYDNELLDAHYIAGDGRANENIGLTAVHSIFHAEHNRLVDQTKVVLITDALQSHDVSFLNQWLLQPITVAQLGALDPEHPDAGLIWNGQNLFQAGRFGTEMQYQHLVFEEFARTIDPTVDEFLAPLGYDATINPAIVAEFAHTVYRFGHSMLTETVDRLDPNFNLVNDPNSPDGQLGLIAAFLNPLEFVASGPTPEQAVGAIVRGVTRTTGNAIDEFITEALRNNLLGTPLDLAVLNLARGRDTGIPSLNEARREFYSMTNNNDVGDSNMKPYVSWVDFMNHMKHPESLINFIAAYGTHAALLDANVDTLAEMRAVAAALVLGGSAAINNADGTLNHIFTADENDRLDFLNSTGAYANSADGHVSTGVDDIDFWVGGLAEQITPFNSMLGSTFNFVFENQLEALQNGDRFYYLARTAGLHFGTELENSLFSQLVMLNTDVTHLPADIFSVPTWTLEVDKTKQFTGLGADGRADPTVADDPTGGILINGHVFTDVVVRDNPNTVGPDSNYLQYIGENHVVLGGSNASNDILIAGEGDDTIYGDAGNDRLEGGAGDDQLFGGAGDDIITDAGGTDVIHGDTGNDVLIDSHTPFAAEVATILLGGDGKDFIATWDDVNIIFGGQGDDFMYGSKPNLPMTGNEGDDWIEIGTQDGAPGDNFAPLLTDDVRGNDIFVGGGGFDEMIGEGGDDIFVGSDAQDKMDGMSGYDWVTYKSDKIGVTVDLALAALNEPPVAASPASILDRFAEVEGLSGSKYADYLRGDNVDAGTIVGHGSALGDALHTSSLSLINGLQQWLAHVGLVDDPLTGLVAGNIILGGDGSDVIIGMGGDDLIDGDKWLNVRVSVRANTDGTGAEIASFDSLKDLIPFMASGTYNPGQLVAVREILDGTGGFDTVLYQGNRTDYLVTIDDKGTELDFSDDVVTVTDLRAKAIDGTDHLTHVERIMFQDGSSSVLVPFQNFNPTGRPTITDANGGTLTVGDLVTVSIAGVNDFDNNAASAGAVTGPVRYTWQQDPGTGIWEDIIVLPGGDLAFETASGKSFRLTPDLAGLTLRVKAMYTDAHGVTEIVYSDPTATVAAGAPVALTPPPATDPSMAEGGEGIKLVRTDLDFILTQIKIAETHAGGVPLQDLIPNIRLAYGLRSVDGSENNLLHDGGFDQTGFGAADNSFPRLLDPQFNSAEAGTSYNQTNGLVIDSQPRVISNLIVDQTSANPAAYASAYNPGANGVLDFNGALGDDTLKDGVSIVKSPGLDGQFNTADDRDVFMFPNVTPDAGLGAPFNAWFTFFGQFFDHGLDLVTKGGNGTIFIPLNNDDPLVAGADGIFGNADDLPPQLRFMVETRATMEPGPDGVIGTADDVHENENTTTPFVDQNQTYSSHPSHQVFLRAYQLVTEGADNHLAPIATGKLIENRDLGADGKYGTADDTFIGGMATWKVVKAQARDVLGINLTDRDVSDLPLLATDQYGNFIPGAHGLPQVVMHTAGGDGIFGTADDGTTLVEGNLANPIDLTHAVRTGHQFLIDIADAAAPVFDINGNPLADTDTDIGNAQPRDAQGHKLSYDNELLDAHYIAGDGRVNENIGLTTVHAIFHSEHNRLVDQVKDTILHNGDLAFLNEWLLAPVGSLADALAHPETLVWNGERLFQAAKFGTEMQYQHLVFEEFARTVQPSVDPFFAPTQVYDVDLNPAIVAEFAHTVYRFGHSMLTETVDRLDQDFNVVGDPNSADPDQQLGLIAAFLNPLAYAASGDTPEDATSAIIRGLTRQVGNEIDEFVTDALRNNLLGTPLDLAVLNIARGRDTGIPTLQAARRDFYHQTGDTWVKPYISWADMAQHLKHPESLINFIAAYGHHTAITAATTLADKRAAALLLVLGDGNDADGVVINGVTYNDRLDFLNATGAWADGNTTHTLDRDGVSRTGLGDIDFWIGGLAEAQMPFGGLLGSTFNFVFEAQLEKLQDGDRFYYLERTSGLSFGTELESNSFAKLIMANTNLTHLPALVFGTPAFTLEVDQSKQHTGLGADGRADPTGGITIGATEITKLVIRDDPHTPAHETNYLQYTGQDHVVLGGTSGDDTLISSIGDDTLWGDEGSDHIDGGYGDDSLRGGAGNDYITDAGGLDNIQGGDGNDYIQGGGGTDLILGGFGNDFIVTGEDNSEGFGGAGDDFILGNKSNEQDIGNEGDDWIEKGTSDGAPGDNFDPLGNDPIPGNDIFLGDGENDKFIGEGGDDIMVGSTGLTDRFFGGSGFDWATYKNDLVGVTIDFSGRFFDQPPVPGSGASALARFDIMEGLSGSSHNDYLAGDDAVDLVGGEVGAGVNGSALVNIGLINGLQAFLDTALGTHIDAFTTGNIIMGGDGSDFLMGRGGDDILDGDAWLNVRIGVYSVADVNHTGPTIASYNTMQEMVPLVANGSIQISQLKAIREVLYADGPDFDTAKFSGDLANYTFLVDGVARTAAQLANIGLNHVITVTDNVGADGTDHVMHVERLQFADQSIVMGGLNHAPTGSLQLGTAVEGSPITVSNLLFDADNIGAANPTGTVRAPVAYFWQVDDGTGFDDITTLAAGEVARVGGTTFTPTGAEVGLPIRVRAVYIDGNGVLEEAFSNAVVVGNLNDAPVGVPTISDTTPTEGIAITASTAGITDADGLTTAVFSFQWQRSATGATWTDIAGAQSFIYTPVQADVLQLLRVVVQYLDDLGTLETVVSAATGNVGDHIIGNQNGNTLNGTNFDDWLEGLAGVDNLNGGAGSDILDGGLGGDTLNGNDGDDTLIGGGGNDTMNGGAGADQMIGGVGNDTYIVDDAGDLVIENAAEGTDEVQTSLGVYTLAAEVENLTYTGAAAFAGTGNALNNVITGGAGADTLDGAAGNDTLNGGNGNDSLLGGAGNDAVNGGAGNDTLNGGAGNDNINGGTGSDTASYADETRNMAINLANGTARAITALPATLGPVEDNLTNIENVLGGLGADTITGDGAANVLDGAAGNDTINGGNGNDTILGGAGNDVLNGQGGNDSINGGAGNDSIAFTMGDGVDTIDGGANTDTLTITGTAGGETLDLVYDGTRITQVEGGLVSGLESIIANLGNGTDTISFAASTVGVTASLAGLVAGLTSFTSVENLTGGTGDDVLTGSATANTLSGGAGNDTLNGGAGADTLSGGAGNDTYFVDNINDTINEAAGGGTDTVFSTTGTYTLANNVDNLTFLNAGAANGQGNGQNNVITGGTGANNLSGNGGNDTLTGGSLNDNLDGGAGDDTLNGLGGNDTLTGGGGIDHLFGGAGNDTMNGGAGNDFIVFDTAGFGNDVINGFDANPAGGGQDLLDISALGINAATFASTVHITALGANTLIVIDGMGQITLNGVAAAQVNASDFILHP